MTPGVYINKIAHDEWYLGPTWDYIATDRTEGSSGNLERMVFVFDRRKVRFNKIASGIVLQIDFSDEYLQGLRNG